MSPEEGTELFLMNPDYPLRGLPVSYRNGKVCNTMLCISNTGPEFLNSMGSFMLFTVSHRRLYPLYEQIHVKLMHILPHY
jgi:hypothetical protein